MLLNKFADEIDLLSRVDIWLTKSLNHAAPWGTPEDEAAHGEAVRKFHSMNIAMRFPSGDIQAEALAGALATELRRLAGGPALLRFALKKCVWPDAFGVEGHALLATLDTAGLE